MCQHLIKGEKKTIVGCELGLLASLVC
jgi:hypothetical protein